jgi:hypothetical protein
LVDEKLLVREIENPSIFECFSKRRFRRVDFPVPEGPDTTMGRSSSRLVVHIIGIYFALK